MSKVLTDIYSLFSFKKAYDKIYQVNKTDSLSINYSLIENLILCDKVIIERNGASHYEVEPICFSIPDAFDFIKDDRLYQANEKVGYVYSTGGDNSRTVLYADIARENH